MARWLRDAETGELFREDELDAGSYDQITDFQPIAPAESEAPQYEYPSWLTSGLGTSIPARSLASITKSGASIEELLGDLASNVPGLEDNFLLRDAAENRKRAEDLLNQARRDNQVEPGSLEDIGGAIAGEMIPSLGTLGYGLARGAGRAALAMAPALLPSASRYGDLKDEGVSGPRAALGAAGSFGINSLLNRADVGTALNALSSPAKRIGQTALVGGATNAAGAIGDAYIDKQVGAPQTRDEFITNLLTSTGAGIGTGAGFGAMGALGRAADTQAPDGQGVGDLMSRMQQDVPQGDSQQAARAFNEYASDPFQNFMTMPEPFAGENTFIPDSMVRNVRGRPAPEVDPLANITPDEAPLIQLEEGSRARTEEEIGRAREVLDVITPWQSDNTRQRRLEDIFMPVDSELAGFRQSLPEGTLAPSEGQGSPIVKPFTQKGAINKNLPVDEQNVVRAVLEAEPARKAKAEQAEILARREAARANNKGNVIGRGDELVIKSPEGTQSFPDPIKLITAEPEATNPAAIQLEEGFRARTPEQINEAQQTLRDSSWEVFKREDGRPEQGPIVAPKDQIPLFDPMGEQPVISPKPEANAGLKLYVDGVEGREIPYTDVPTGNQAFQYAIGRVTSDGGEAVFRRPIGQRGSYGGWRWENDASKLRSKPIIEEQVAAVKPEGTAPDDLRNTLGKRTATRRKRPVPNKESGFVDLSDLAEFFRNRRNKKEAQKFPEYKDWSDSNKRYADGSWGRRWEWMDTTKRKEPASAPFINSQWRIPQDTHAIVWDADETLAPYKSPELSPKERRGVNNYLQAARILGSKDKGYKVSAETAATAGLNPKQVEAALAVKRWSDFYADIFENDSLAQAEHFAAMETLKAPNDEYKATIAKRLVETKAQIAETFKQWRDSNYVPFDRYGEHYVNVFAPDGTLLAREQFESKNDPGYKKAIAHYQELAKQSGDFAGAAVKVGRQAPRQLLQDFEVNQDVLDILGTDGSGQPVAGFSRHFKNAKLIPGYNRDLDRAITDYTVGAARLLAFRRANRVAEMELATTLAGDDKINLRNKLIEFKDSLNNPRGEGAKLINEYFNFAFIGGNARVAVADTLGFFQMQPMVLSKYLKGIDTEKVELKTYGNLISYYFGRKLDDGMSAGIKEAQRKGLIPTDTFKTYLRARRGPSDTMKAMTTVKDAYFSLKALSERTVDAGAFMSGWEAWRRLPPNVKRTVSQQQFAENMIREMKAVPSQMELPPNALFKTETGRLVSKFRLYQVKLAKTIAETPMPGKLRGALRMFLTVGLAGLPLVKEAFNFSRVAGVEPEDKLREAGYGSETMYGPLSAATGVDWSGTAGYGEVFSSQAENPFSKFALGMLGAPAEAGLRAAQYLDRGQTRKAVASLPISNLLSNYLNQADWGERGVVTMGGQAVIPRDDVQGVDRLKKLFGFQPLRVKEAMVLENRKKQAANTGRATGFYNQRIGEALGLGNVEEAQALIQQAQEEGVRLNQNSIKEYRAKIQGRDGKIPKRARGEVQRVDQLYGNALRD